MNLGDTFIDNLVVSRGKRRPSLTSDSSFWWDAFLPDLPEADSVAKESRHSSESAPASPAGRSGGWQLLPFWFLLLAIAGILVGKLYTLQIAHGRKNLILSEVNRVLSQVVKPERGVILDRNGEVFARNQPGFSVVLNLEEGGGQNTEDRFRKQKTENGNVVLPSVIRPLDPSSALCPRSSRFGMAVCNLSKTLSVSEDEILEKIKKAEEEGKTSVTIKSGVDRDTILKIEANTNLFPGVSTEVEPVRDYVDGEVFAHILGFVGEASKEDLARLSALGVRGGDKVGKSNLELIYEQILKGEPGERLIEVDAFGHQFQTVSERSAVSGDSLVLTIDATLQKAVFGALAEGVSKSQAVGGAAVVQDIRTGEVLALVSLPSFDLNLFAKGISESDYRGLLSDPRRPLFNRAVSGSYPPGSTFKLVTATAALEESVVTPQTVIDDKGSISVGSFVFRGWAPEGLGPVNLITGIAKSSDIYFYTVGGGYGSQRGVGVEKLAEWARLFGLGTETMVDLTAEVAGLVPDKEWKLQNRGEPWYIGNTYHMSIGQGDVLVTPLQLNNLVAAIANGGTLFRPFLVKKEAPPEVLRANIASPETLELVRQGMRAAASPGGTAYPVYDFKVPVAGKTGTSEVGRGDKTHAWFTCFAPYDNPEIAVTVFLEEGGEGSHDAAPVVRKILEAYFE